MKKEEASSLAKKLKSLRDELRLTQKEVADKGKTTESAYQAYELGDRNPKAVILGRIARALGVRPEYLSAPTFRNSREFAYAILENEDAFGYTVRDSGGVPAIAKGCGGRWDSLWSSSAIGSRCARSSTTTRPRKRSMRTGSAPGIMAPRLRSITV